MVKLQKNAEYFENFEVLALFLHQDHKSRHFLAPKRRKKFRKLYIYTIIRCCSFRQIQRKRVDFGGKTARTRTKTEKRNSINFPAEERAKFAETCF